MQQSGRNRGIRRLGALVSAIVGATWALWLTGCTPEEDWELTEIGAQDELSEPEDAEPGSMLAADAGEVHDDRSPSRRSPGNEPPRAAPASPEETPAPSSRRSGPRAACDQRNSISP